MRSSEVSGFRCRFPPPHPTPNVPILLVLFIFVLFYVVAICIFLSFLLIRAISSLNCCFEPLPCPQLSRISSRAFCAFIFVLRFLPALSSSPSGFNLATLLHISLPLRKSTATISIDTIPEIVHPFARARRSPCFFNAALGSLLFSRRLLAAGSRVALTVITCCTDLCLFLSFADVCNGVTSRSTACSLGPAFTFIVSAIRSL